jgi:hypothetical protein
VFGKQYIKPFEKVNEIINEIFYANYKLNNRYWKDQGVRSMEGEELERHIIQMHAAEKIIWDDDEENDAIRVRMQEATIQIEELYHKVLGAR